MLKGLTNTFKNNCNATEVVLSEYLVLGNQTIPIKAELSDDCYENGNFIGTFILKSIKFQTDATYNFKNKEFEYYKVVNGESIKIGTFITTEVTISDTNELVSVVGMDYGLKTQVQYTSSLDYASGTITLLDVWNECCTLSGLTSGINNFTNSDFIVDSDQFTGTGATIRDVFKGIAMSSGTFVKVMNDDKIYLIFNETTTDIIEDYTDLEDKRDTHPWTCLRLGMSQVDGENVDYIDEDLVEEYGENWLILNDNPFAYNQAKRQQLIMNIFNQIKEFGYSAFSSKTSFKPYLTCGDVIKFKNRNGDLVSSIVLRYNHNYEDITIEAPSETSATINYVYPLSAIDIAKRTQIEVDKEKGQITSLVENVGILQNQTSTNANNINNLTSLVNSQGEEIDTLGTRITQTAENITANVSAIQQEIDNGVGLVKTTSVTIDDSGLNVSTDTSKISTTMTNNSFEIKDNGDKRLAFFGYDEQEGISKAEMDNLTVTNYFIAGVHRVETIEVDGEQRTGYFYIGG